MDVLINWMEGILSQCIYQITTIYILNILPCCQLYPNKAGKKNRKRSIWVFQLSFLPNVEAFLLNYKVAALKKCQK